MGGTHFKLGTFATTAGGTVAAIVLGDNVIGIAAAYRTFREFARWPRPSARRHQVDFRAA